MKNVFLLAILMLGIMITVPSFDSVADPVGYEQADLASVDVVFVAPEEITFETVITPTFEALEIALPLAGEQPLLILTLDQYQFEALVVELAELNDSRLKRTLSETEITRGASMHLKYPSNGVIWEVQIIQPLSR